MALSGASLGEEKRYENSADSYGHRSGCSRGSTPYQPEALGASLHRLQRKNRTRRSARRPGVLLPDQRRPRHSPVPILPSGIVGKIAATSSVPPKQLRKLLRAKSEFADNRTKFLYVVCRPDEVRGMRLGLACAWDRRTASVFLGVSSGR